MRAFTACALCGLGVSCVSLRSMAGVGPALLDLSPQTYPVRPVPEDVPIDLSGTSGAGTGAGRVASFGLVPAAYALRILDGLYGPDGAVDDDPAGRVDSAIPGVADIWSFGSRSWRYAGSAGYGLTLGNEPVRAPSWSRPTRLAGVGVYGGTPRGIRQAGGWTYAAAAGVLDEDPSSTVTSGGLAYGPAAYDVSSQYAVGPGLSLASQVQGMPELLALGLGGEYSAGGWGAVALGVARSRQSLGSGWRYQLGYKVDVFSDLGLSWVNEQRGAGYADLSTYREDPLACDCVRNQWRLSMPMGRWGRLSGTYEQRSRALDGLQRTVGLAQGFRYGPHLKVRLEANGNIATGAYGLGARFSVPID
ncbi:hypothetical protein [Castellaniella sp. GW247-6E4]|uniref:hypothetical protein n=1 Tax=Castellaniella sp. GW247-6E4 TaxID=3140380 RepID=UPI0033147887